MWFVSHSLSPTANVHCICEEFKVYLSQCAAHDQLHAAHAGRDVCPGHTHLLPACLHLHPPACHSSAQCNDHKEEGGCLPVWKESPPVGHVWREGNYCSCLRLLVSPNSQYLSDLFHNVPGNSFARGWVLHSCL